MPKAPKKQQAHLEDWEVRAYPPHRILTGIVTGHPLLPDGRAVATSQLIRLDRKRSVAHTLNTRYTLGAGRVIV